MTPVRSRDCSRCGTHFQPTGWRGEFCKACQEIRAVERLAEKRAYDKVRHVEKREENIARVAAWNRSNKDRKKSYDALYRVKNAERRAASESKRSAAMHGCAQKYGLTVARLDARMRYHGNKCWMCGGPFEHVDHVKPLSKGGPHMLSNLRPACAPCNIAKRDKWPFATPHQGAA